MRSAIALQELLSQLGVRPTATGAQVWYQNMDWTAGAVTAVARIAELVRPPPIVFSGQVPLVKGWASLREERAAEILAQIDNTFAFLASVVYLHPARTPRTFELLAIAIQMAVNVEMRVKHALACYRPSELSPQIQPMLTTPGHGSLPSGHATQAYVTVHVLKRLLNLRPGTHDNEILQLDRQVARIATNRVIAGVHFPLDSIAGRALGQSLGEYFDAGPESLAGRPTCGRQPRRATRSTATTRISRCPIHRPSFIRACSRWTGRAPALRSTAQPRLGSFRRRRRCSSTCGSGPNSSGPASSASDHGLESRCRLEEPARGPPAAADSYVIWAQLTAWVDYPTAPWTPPQLPWHCRLIRFMFALLGLTSSLPRMPVAAPSALRRAVIIELDDVANLGKFIALAATMANDIEVPPIYAIDLVNGLAPPTYGRYLTAFVTAAGLQRLALPAPDIGRYVKRFDLCEVIEPERPFAASGAPGPARRRGRRPSRPTSSWESSTTAVPTRTARSGRWSAVSPRRDLPPSGIRTRSALRFRHDPRPCPRTARRRTSSSRDGRSGVAIPSSAPPWAWMTGCRASTAP